MDLGLPPHTGEVLGLFVAPPYWGHGMGRKLLVRGLSVLKRRQFESAFLWVRDDLPRVADIVESLGFERAVMQRTTNLGTGERVETAFHKSLEDYF